jgi:tetratricopeptide (TPR) repeat protein
MIRPLSFLILLSACCSFADYGAQRALLLAGAKDGRREEALAAFRALAAAQDDPYRRSDALERAAVLAQTMKRHDEALELAAAIPLLWRARTVRMRLLAERGFWKQVAEESAADDIAAWPPAVAAEALALRGQALRKQGRPAEALADLEASVRLQPGGAICLELAGLYAELGRDVEAMDAYGLAQRVVPDRRSWVYITSVLRRAAILLRKELYAAALHELDQCANPPGGFWEAALLKLRGEVLAARGNIAEAMEAYRRALTVKGLHDVQRRELEALLAALDTTPATTDDDGEAAASPQP